MLTKGRQAEEARLEMGRREDHRREGRPLKGIKNGVTEKKSKARPSNKRRAKRPGTERAQTHY